MGAHDFLTVGFGRTFADAYEAAVENAMYERGHDPYNGTISTTHGYNAVVLPNALKLDQFIELCWELHDGIEPKQPATRRKFDGPADRREHERAKRLWKTWSRLSYVDQEAVRKGARFEKWEACTAVELTGKQAVDMKKAAGKAGTRAKVFVFFGLAAS